MKKILFFVSILFLALLGLQTLAATKSIRGISIDFAPGFGKPIPATVEVKSKNPNDAILKGSLDWLGYAKSNNVYFVYYEPGRAFQKTKSVAVNSKGEFFSESLKLKAATNYCFFAVAENGRTQGAGAQQCFITDGSMSGGAFSLSKTLDQPLFLSNDKSLPNPAPASEKEDLKSVLENRINILPPVKDALGFRLQMEILDLNYFKGALPFFELAKKDGSQRYVLNFKNSISVSRFSAYLSASFPLSDYQVFGGAIKDGKKYFGNNVSGASGSAGASPSGKAAFYFCRVNSGQCDKSEQFATKEDCENYLSTKEVDAKGVAKTPGICHSTQLSCDLTCEGYKPKVAKTQECYKGVLVYYNSDGSASTKGFQTAGVSDEIRYATPEMAQESIEIFFKQGKSLAKAQCSDPKDPKGTWYFCVKNTGHCRATFGVKDSKGAYQPYTTKEACESNVRKWWGSTQTNETCYPEKYACENICQEYTNPTTNKFFILTAGGEPADNNKFRIWYNLVSLASNSSARVWAKITSSDSSGRALVINTEPVELKDKRLDYFEIVMPTPKFNLFTYEILAKGSDGQSYSGGYQVYYTGSSGTSCGNDNCEHGETPQNCPQDCRISFTECHAFNNTYLISNNAYQSLNFLIRRPVSGQLVVDSIKNGWQKFTSSQLWGGLTVAPAGEAETNNSVNEISISKNFPDYLLGYTFYTNMFDPKDSNKIYPIECDIHLNSNLANDKTKFSPIVGYNQAQTTLIHEMGHCLNMGDLYDLSLVKSENGQGLQPNYCGGQLCYKNCPDEIMNNSPTIGTGDITGLNMQFPKK